MTNLSDTPGAGVVVIAVVCACVIAVAIVDASGVVAIVGAVVVFVAIVCAGAVAVVIVDVVHIPREPYPLVQNKIPLGAELPDQLYLLLLLRQNKIFYSFQLLLLLPLLPLLLLHPIHYYHTIVACAIIPHKLLFQLLVLVLPHVQYL